MLLIKFYYFTLSTHVNAYQCVFLCHQDEAIAVNQVAVNVLFKQTAYVKGQQKELV